MIASYYLGAELTTAGITSTIAQLKAVSIFYPILTFPNLPYPLNLSSIRVVGIFDPLTHQNVVLNVWSLACAIAGTQLLINWGRKPSALACQLSLIIMLYVIGGLSKVYSDNTAAGVTSTNSLIYGNVACMFLFQGFYSYVMLEMSSRSYLY
jgi:hypothetical protein